MESVAGNSLWMIPVTGLSDLQVLLVMDLRLITHSMPQPVSTEPVLLDLPGDLPGAATPDPKKNLWIL